MPAALDSTVPTNDHTLDLTARLATALEGRYTVERELGAGGMAMVYLANDLRHRRKVAIKVLRPELAAALGPERFLREIETVAGLHHPHILPLYDSGEAGGFLFYVMPLVEGESLRDRLNREKQIPIEDALRIAAEVADALSYAHSHGIVHRDIKPENILLESGHAVVADFGIAKAAAAAGEITSLTATGTSIGTPSYMSPEQAAGERDLDGRSDLYSLGCVLFEMLAGQPPFSGTTAQAVVRQHMVTTPPPITQFRPAVPPGVADALARALAKNPADRFNPVGQFATALSTPRTGTVEVTPATRPNRGIAVAIAIAVVLIAGTAWSFLRRSNGGDDKVRSIAVLPFANLGGDSTTNPMVLGMHAELITQLTKLASLQVASRSSALEYQDSKKSERQIASELGVTNLLTGSIQRSGDEIRFTVALSDAEKGTQLWAESYDRSYTAENLFAMQADIARSVAGALSVRLSPAQDTAIARPPTANLAALNLYYQALAGWESRGNSNDTATIRMLKDAVALDPNFAAAWGLLAQMQSWLLRQGFTVDTLPAFQALQKVQSLVPGSIEASLASGYYAYYGKGDFKGALQSMDEAARQQPNSVEFMLVRALLLRRLNRWNEALALLERAHALDPRHVSVLTNLGETYRFMGRLDDAMSAFDRALALSPSNSTAIGSRFLCLVMKGDTAEAFRFAAVSAPVAAAITGAIMQYQTGMLRRDYPAALRGAQRIPESFYTSAFGSRFSGLAEIYWLMGDSARMRAVVDTMLRVGARVAEARTRPGLGDPFGGRAQVMLTLAVGYALRNDLTRAIAMVDSALALYPPAEDVVDGGGDLRMAAIGYMMAGQADGAVAALREMLSRPSEISPELLRLDPVWDQLRQHPGFQQLQKE
ncbi:MAG: protein kinase [Gemmatimonadota bacterium]